MKKIYQLVMLSLAVLPIGIVAGFGIATALETSYLLWLTDLCWDYGHLSLLQSTCEGI